MTQQEIYERCKALGVEQGEAYKRETARIAKERESLQELCGSMGHLFRPNRSNFFGNAEQCVHCGVVAPGGDKVECTSLDREVIKPLGAKFSLKRGD